MLEKINQIDTLNEIITLMIDSHKGYEACLKVLDNHPLEQRFAKRALERSFLIQTFQNQVSSLGGEPSESGSISGALHRKWTQFTTVFKDDLEAALQAIDDGEEFLANKIKESFFAEDLSVETKALLQKAFVSACEGEKLAEVTADKLQGSLSQAEALNA